MSSSAEYSDAYFRTRFAYDDSRNGIWRAICDYLQPYILPEASVLDIGAGYCTFINNVRATQKYALDLYPEFTRFALPNVKTFVGSCENLGMFSPEELDVVFASNLLEHLSREAIERTLAEVRRVLRPSGYFIIIQPNYRYCYREYFDDYTHIQVFTHVGLADMLTSWHFTVEKIIPRFLPFSFKSRLPKWSWLAQVYMRLPVRPFAKQMLIISRRTE